MYLFHIAVMIDGVERPEFELALEQAIQSFWPRQKAEVVSTRTEILVGHNFGQCKKCGTWVSDSRKDNRITAFSDGASIDGAWFCDLCLPPDHPNVF